jgi:hypothetical protein
VRLHLCAGRAFSLITIDLPNKNYLWIIAEVVLAALLVQGAISNVRRVYRGGR